MKRMLMELSLKLETFSKIEMKRIEIHFDFKMKQNLNSVLILN